MQIVSSTEAEIANVDYKCAQTQRLTFPWLQGPNAPAVLSLSR